MDPVVQNNEGPENPEASQYEIDSLVDAFGSSSGIVRQAARERLCEIGEPAVPALIAALDSPEEQVRWEAAKSLGQIPDPRAADALVARLGDAFSIRWLASDALINIGLPALEPLIRGLLANPDAPRLRVSAHHVLSALKRDHPSNPYIDEMLRALSGQAQTETVPWVARAILMKIGRIPSYEEP